MNQQIEKNNIKNVHWYPAYDGHSINDTFSLKINIPYGYCYRKGEDLGKGSVGCTLSHIGCISLAHTMKWEYVIVLEDDIILCDDWNKRIDYLFKILPSDWEHVYLSGAPHNVRELDSNHMLLNYMNILPSAWTSTTYGYVLKNTAYLTVIKKLSTLGSGPDELLNHAIFEDKAIKSYSYFPYVLCANLDIESHSDFGLKKMPSHPSIKYFKNNM
jgi:GR25 family glycosyltransferase involved in LPS biosynthesis